MSKVNPDELFVILNYGEFLVRLTDIERVFAVETEYVSGKGRIPKTVKTLAGKEIVVVDGRAVIAAQARTKLEVDKNE